jgi:hypothetical protein
MKKITLIALSVMCFATMANALTFYVDGVNGDDTFDGQTWATAKKTVKMAATMAYGTPGVDEVFVKGGTYEQGMGQLRFLTGDNYYGGFAGTETSPSERLLNDNDGNGITEAWEFKYPTILSSVSVNRDTNTAGVSAPGAFVVNFAPTGSTLTAIIVDGFTFTHVLTNTSLVVTINTSNPSVFRNNSITNCMLSYPVTGSYWSVLCSAKGSFTNNLIENNSLSLTATATYNNGTAYPMLFISSETKVSNCIVRNNVLNLDYSQMNPNATAIGNAYGLMVHVEGKTPYSANNKTSVVKNCIIHNNEINYTGRMTTHPTTGATIDLTKLSRGAIFITSNTFPTDSILNCVIANNKTTNCASAGLHLYFNSFGSAATPQNGIQAWNNVCWNNQNDGVVSNMKWSAGTGLTWNVNTLISNNYTNGGGIDNLFPNIASLDNTLDALTNNPKFKTPSVIVGNTYDLSSEQSVWSIQEGSYLAGKGLTSSNLTDKAGKTFKNPGAVGAYELANLSALHNAFENKAFNVVAGKNRLDVMNITTGSIATVYNLAGMKMAQKDITSSALSFDLQSGIYLVRIGNSVQKAIVR